MSESLETLKKELPDGAFWPTGGWMRRLLSALLSDRARLAQGSGQEIPVDGAGRFFVIDPGSGGAGTARHPFQVLSEEPTEAEEPRVSVHLDSWLSGSLRCDDKITVAGLGVPFVFPATVGRLIYLKVALDASGVVAAATVEHGLKWDSYPSPLKRTGSGATDRQQDAYALIASTRAVDPLFPFPDRIKLSATVEIMQHCTTHLRLCRDCYEGDDALKLLVPHSSPGPVLA